MKRVTLEAIKQARKLRDLDKNVFRKKSAHLRRSPPRSCERVEIT